MPNNSSAQNSVSSLLNPRSIAIVGASRHKNKVGYQVLKNIITGGFPGKIFPINPNANKILGLEVFPTLTNLQVTPELVIIITPAPIAPMILQEAADIGSKVAIIITAGFAETSHQGKLLQDKLARIVEKSHIRVIGPNCLGVINTKSKLNATFGPPLPKIGNIMLISQSGAMVTGILDWAATHNLGLSNAITLGNRIDINENEALKYASQDNNTHTILVYLESFYDPQEFFSLASAITPTKPIILLKGGKSKAGQLASASHTAALATDYALTESFSKQTGVILAENLHQFLNTAAIFTISKPIKGPELAIITNAGGPGVVSTDEAVSSGLNIVPVTKQTRSLLKTALNLSHPHNPIDILGDALPDDFQKALHIIDKDTIQDAILIIITPQTTTQPLATAQVIASYAKKSKKPVFVVLIGGKKLASAKKVLERAHIPVFSYPKEAIDLIAHRAFYHLSKQKSLQYPSKPRALLTESQIKKLNTSLEQKFDLNTAFSLLKAYDIRIPRFKIIKNESKIKPSLDHTNTPAVIKTGSLNVMHKKKVGGVFTNIMNPLQARLAFNKLQRIDSQVLIQQTIYSPIEIIIGAKKDDHFGIFITIGLGGSLTDSIKDRTFAFYPTNKNYLKTVFSQTNAYSLLNNNKDLIDQVVHVMESLGHSLHTFDSLKEIEINPLLLTQNKVFAVDIKIQKNSIDTNHQSSLE